MMDIRLLEQLAAVRRYGTLSGAARHLYLSQPSVSRAMRKLEESLDAALFTRQKNKILLNETGLLAADWADRILKDEDDMMRSVRAFDRSLRTIVIGSCAPGPLMPLLAGLASAADGRPVSFDMDTEENLKNGLQAGKYGMILLSSPFQAEGVGCRAYIHEQLFVSVKPFHPAASCETVSFRQMDGQNFLMLARVGIWEGIVRRNMPHAKFFRQESEDALKELSRFSDLPAFVTDISEKWMERSRPGRISVPFSDAEASVWFYLAWRDGAKDVAGRV